MLIILDLEPTDEDKNGEYVGLSSSAFLMHRMLFKTQRLSVENMSSMQFRYFQI